MQGYQNPAQVGPGSTGFHLALYNLAAPGNGGALQDMLLVADPVISQRNNHMTLTDDWRLIMAQQLSTAPTEAVIKAPTWNAQTLWNIDPVQASLTQPNPPMVMYLGDSAPTLPQDEEIQVQVSDITVAAQQITAGLWLAPKTWNRNIPAGLPPLRWFSAKVSITVALTAAAFSPLVQLTFEQGLRAGVYAVVGARFYIANALYFRMLFPRSTMYAGRSMRPGNIVDNAIGVQAWYTNLNTTVPLGVWGRFQTYELPQVEVYSSATVGSATYQGRLALVKISDSPDPGMLGL